MLFQSHWGALVIEGRLVTLKLARGNFFDCHLLVSHSLSATSVTADVWPQNFILFLS